MKIGVFDSGVGGLSVVKAIQSALPDDEIAYHQDRANVPYGNKTPAELLRLVIPIFATMVAEGCQVIVIACNTVSTNIVHDLREQFDIPLIAMEPMVKPAAAATKTGIIAVCATPATLQSQRYQWLKAQYASEVTVLEPDCSDWAYMIEHGAVEQSVISERIDSVLDQGADVVVLGCTHYHWIEAEIQKLCSGRATVIQPEQAVIRQLKRVLARLP